MAATKYSNGTPDGGYCVIDAQAAANGNASGLPSIVGAPGYDDGLIGNQLVATPASQGTNPIAGANGNVLIDTNNDYLAVDASRSTVSGNPAHNSPTASSLSKVVVNTQGVRLVFKNPA